ncbi:MAG: HAMP domain-containing histidine kinase [Burkholderiales bacterium]|nr:HAMP domain-containing histidine kinase [Burkholderiales bacterium]
MGQRLNHYVERLNATVDWFVPEKLKQTPGMLQAVRMFLFSHLFGPILGHTITLSMLFLRGGADAAWWVLFIAITAFWPFAFVLRLTGWYVPLSLLSIQNLMFCIFWGCYQYGGISSPIMPWLVTVPLLGFFYLPGRSTRIAVCLLIVANLGLFYGLYDVYGFHKTVAAESLVILGLVSTFSASAYVSMMALYFANIVYSQGELEREIGQHQATERRLRNAAAQARRALAAKSDFLAKMSHELKNPLNAVIGYSEILIEDSDEADLQKRRDLDTIRDAGHQLLRLIDTLLELSRLEAGKAELRVEEFDVADFVEQLVARARPSVTARGNELILQALPPGRMACDMQKLERVVEGLLSNAAKFTQNGRITVSALIQRGTCTLSIQDTGVGIGQERMANLFETMGTSADETSSKYDDEVRLGLPLAYRYCRLMGGHLSVASQLGRGSTVVVSLPTQPRRAEEQADGGIEDLPLAA